MSYEVVRDNHSGGSVGIAFADTGRPTYAVDGEKTCLFVREDDARAFIALADRCLPHIEGQSKEFRIVELEEQ